MKRLFSLLALVAGVVLVYYRFIKSPDVPELPDEVWSDNKIESNPREFKIQVSDQVIRDLKTRLKNTNALTPPLKGVGFEYGFNADYLKYIIDHWINRYDWSKRQDLLNSVPQYTIGISGLKIHYIHIKPKPLIDNGNSRKVLPLLLLHGWPGSIKEFYSVLPLLSQAHVKYDFALEIIVPSLPGYGFSDGATKPGLGPPQIALVMKKLMETLGHKKFYVQGGDWGAVISAFIGTLYPDSLLGLHSNMCGSTTPLSLMKLLIGTIWPPLIVESKYQHRVYPLSDKFHFMLEEFGYFHIQATKPDTVSVGLRDSPAGLAAYILEKYSTWVNPSWKNLTDGGLSIVENYSLDDLLDNVMIYWITGSITTSVRLYSEAFNKKQAAMQLDKIPIHVPSICAAYPNEILFFPESVIRDKYTNLLYMSHLPKGGHFAAFEQPAIFAEDLLTSIQAFERYHKEKEKQEL